jgi:hypothetical protein
MPLVQHVSPFRLIVSSTKTTTILACPSSTAIRTLYSNSWKASTRRVRFPYRTWYALVPRRHAVRRAHTLKVLVLRSRCDPLTCRRPLRSVSTAPGQDAHRRLFRRRRSGRGIPPCPRKSADCPLGKHTTAGNIATRSNSS